MSTSKKKNLGQGMKPRGNQAETEKAEESVSADEGQEETSVEAVSEAPDGEQTPNNLEPEFEVDRIDLYVASPDPSKYTLIDSIATKDETVDLRKLLYDSGEGEPEMQRLPEEKSDVQKAAETFLVQNLDSERNAFPTAEDIAKYPIKRPDGGSVEKLLDLVKERANDVERFIMEKFPPQRLERLKEVMAEIEAMDHLGQQPDGTFRLPIDIAEGSIEPIRQEAESNGMTAEQWCSQQFNFFLESWWAKPKGR